MLKRLNKKIILVGPAASGKDYIKSELVKLGYVGDVAFTTRPPRINEINGVDYHFVTEEKFDNLDLFESVEFNGWKYGKTRESWDKSDIFIMTPAGIGKLSPKYRNKSFVILVDVDEIERIKRLKMRNDTSDSIERRIKADEIDFRKFANFDTVLFNFNKENIQYTLMKLLEYSTW
jgi:guanylate kinase